MAVVNVSTEAHERAKTEAALCRIGIGEWVSRQILFSPEPLLEAARERSETPAETLEAALAALAAPSAVTPLKRNVLVHEDGFPYCGCDGDTSYGPHHRGTCHRRTP